LQNAGQHGAGKHRQKQFDPGFPHAVGARDAAFAFVGLTVVPPGHEVIDYLDSGRELGEALSPWLCDNAHPSFLGPTDATESGTRLAYDPDTYKRLQAVKAKYDPYNVFRTNHNIPPNNWLAVLLKGATST
jgi:hypothetical protein